MRDWVGEWVQEGRLYVWRCSDAGVGRRGWQWTADPLGCRSVRNLLDRMQGGEPCHRVLRLEPVTDAILSVPNAGYRVAERFSRLRIDHRPDLDALQVAPNGETLNLTIGGRRLRKLSAALGRVEVGGGDFEVDPGGHTEDSWMFWWMPDVDYSDRTRL